MNKNNPLEITEDEKAAMMIYGGDIYNELVHNGKYNVFYGEEHVYRFINAMFFEGINNELARMYDDKSYFPSNLVYLSNDLIKLIEDLYSAMYKYGKTMKSAEKGFRVERLSSVNEMKKSGTTISNLSTSNIGYYVNKFFKKDMALLEVNIEPGVPCVNFQKVLSEIRYQNASEEEILIAPFCPINIEKNNKELSINKVIKDRAIAKEVNEENFFKVRVSKPERPKALTYEEKMDKEIQKSICCNENLQHIVYLILDKMYEISLTSIQKTKEQIKEQLKEEIAEYLKWKTAFFKVTKYGIREKALQIEEEIEQYPNELKYQGDEIEKLTEKNIEEINNETVRDVMSTSILATNLQTRVDNKEEKGI